MSRVFNIARHSRRIGPQWNSKSLYLDGVSDHVDLLGNYWEYNVNNTNPKCSLFYDNGCTVSREQQGYRPQWWNIWVKIPQQQLNDVIIHGNVTGNDMKYFIMTTGTGQANTWGGQHLGLVRTDFGGVTFAAGWGDDDKTTVGGRVLRTVYDDLNGNHFTIFGDIWYMVTVIFRGRDELNGAPSIDLHINNVNYNSKMVPHYPIGITSGEYTGDSRWSHTLPNPDQRLDSAGDWAFIGRKGNTYTEMYVADLQIWDDCKPSSEALGNLYGSGRKPRSHAYNAGYQITPSARNWWNGLHMGGHYKQITQVGKRDGMISFKFPSFVNTMGPAFNTSLYHGWWFEFEYANGTKDKFEFVTTDQYPALWAEGGNIAVGAAGYTQNDFGSYRTPSGNWPIFIGGDDSGFNIGNSGRLAATLHMEFTVYANDISGTYNGKDYLNPIMPWYAQTSSVGGPTAFWTYNTQHPIHLNDNNPGNPTGEGDSFQFSNSSPRDIGGYQEVNTTINYKDVAGARHFFGSGSYYGQTPGAPPGQGSNAPVSFSMGTQLMAAHYKFHGHKHYGELFPGGDTTPATGSDSTDGVHYPGLQYIDKTIGTTHQLRGISLGTTMTTLHNVFPQRVTCFDIINHGGSWTSDFPPNSGSQYLPF